MLLMTTVLKSLLYVIMNETLIPLGSCPAILYVEEQWASARGYPGIWRELHPWILIKDAMGLLFCWLHQKHGRWPYAIPNCRRHPGRGKLNSGGPDKANSTAFLRERTGWPVRAASRCLASRSSTGSSWYPTTTKPCDDRARRRSKAGARSSTADYCGRAILYELSEDTG